MASRDLGQSGGVGNRPEPEKSSTHPPIQPQEGGNQRGASTVSLPAEIRASGCGSEQSCEDYWLGLGSGTGAVTAPVAPPGPSPNSRS